MKFVVAMAGIPALAMLGLIASETHPYIPSNLLAQAAREARYSADARGGMERVLRACRDRRGSGFRAAEIGVRYHQITSWRNDAGWLGQTEIHCADGQACTVAARALIAAPIPGTGCNLATWLPAPR